MPAVHEHAWFAASAVLAQVQEEEADPEQVQALAILLARRGYSQAELAYAMEELMYDATLDRKVSFPEGRVKAADFERVIHAHRAMRARLTMKLTLQDMNTLVEKYPAQLSIDDFGICDYTAAETPLYRYSFAGKVKERLPNPQLQLREDTGSERVRPALESGDGAAVNIGDLI